MADQYFIKCTFWIVEHTDAAIVPTNVAGASQGDSESENYIPFICVNS